jgi:gluconate kinase
MGIRNYLIEGVSGTGKTTVCDELLRRGHQAIHGDRVLAYQGDPDTGAALTGTGHQHHIWDLAKVRALAGDRQAPMTFFCGGSRNFHRFLDLFDKVFVLQVDPQTLRKRLAHRPKDVFGGMPRDRTFILHLHATQADVPKGGIAIDATAPPTRVVDAILAYCGDD